MNVKEIKKLELEYKKQIAHVDPPEQELNLKEQSKLELHSTRETTKSIENSTIGISPSIGSSCTFLKGLLSLARIQHSCHPR